MPHPRAAGRRGGARSTPAPPTWQGVAWGVAMGTCPLAWALGTCQQVGQVIWVRAGEDGVWARVAEGTDLLGGHGS
jgi:hypothetical protein